jgi:AraC family transcriptional regulator
VTRRLDTAGAVLSELAHRSSRVVPEHQHEAPYFCLLVRGSYLEETAGRMFEYRPFSVGFNSPDSSHRGRIGQDGALLFSIELKSGWLDGIRSSLVSSLDLAPRLLAGDLCQLTARLYGLHAEGALDSETVESGLWELVGCLEREQCLADRGTPRWFSDCIDLLHAEFAMPLSIRAVAPVLGVHPVHLSREFRRRFGQTVGEYVHKLRVRAACAALQDSDRPLADIAYATGFSDQSHFCRVFKSLLGSSPGQFRRLLTTR